MISTLNMIADKWWTWQISMLWQTAVLIAVIWVVDLLIRKWAWPQVRYALWMLVLVKLLIPPTFTSPTSVTSHIPAVVQRAVMFYSSPPVKGRNLEGEKGLSVTPALQPQLENHTSLSCTDSAVPSDSMTSTVEAIDSGSIGTPTIMEQPVAPQSPVISLSWKVYTMFTWLAGMAVLSIWLIARLSGLRKEHLSVIPAPTSVIPAPNSVIPAQAGIQRQLNPLPERFCEQLNAAAEKLNLKRLPQVILTDKVVCPAVFGVFHPVLLMPAKKFKSMSNQETEHILLHELAHIKRGDLFVHAVYMTLQIAYWFNPLLWMIRRTLQNLRELCCDATVAKLLREDTVHYRQTLLETARRLLAEPVDPGLGLLGLFENSNWLIARLHWLEKKTWKNTPLRIAAVILLVALMTTCVLPMAIFDPGEPAFIITGTVTDAQTGKPVAGAKVGDVERYNKGLFCTVTDENGYYEYKTWYEEHGVTAQADGYQKQDKGFNTKLFGSEEQKVIDFELEKLSASRVDEVKSWVEDFFKHNYRDISARKTIEWGEPIARDDGNISIRYQYEATIWDKDKIIENKVWTFNQQGEFISVRKVGAEDIYSVAGAQALVDDFFANNYRDVTRRKTIEWGQPVKHENGNVSIRYQYEATIWNKDKIVQNKVWTFDKNGKFVSVDDVPVSPASDKMSEESQNEAAAQSDGSVDIVPTDFKLWFDEKRQVYSLTVSIENRSDRVLPGHKIRYYRGDPADGLDETGYPHTGWHIAGPIEPGKTWNESARGFYMPDGDYTFTVVLDYDNTIPETNEDNNEAVLQVTIKDGRIVKSSLASNTADRPADVHAWESAFNEAVQTIRESENWPEDSVAVSKAFWQARAAKDSDELKLLWPGSASWDHAGRGWKEICAEDTACEYVFGQASADGTRVPYASKEYFDQNGSYNLQMLLAGVDTQSGKRFYVISGN